MAKAAKTEITYRETNLPGIGRVQVPSHLTDEEVLAQVHEADSSTAKKKRPAKKA